MKITGAIFDLDGTLLDSMFIWDSIGSDYLLSRGIQPRPGLREIFRSMSLAQAAEYYRSDYGLTDSVQDIMAGVNRMIDHLYAQVVAAKSGVTEVLESLRRAGVKMCVATATDRYMAEAALERNGLSRYFDGILTCTEVGSGKDEPQIFLSALALLGTEKASTVVFEDALYAIRTAKAAGFPVAAVYDASAESQQEEIRAAADIYLASYAEWGKHDD